MHPRLEIHSVDNSNSSISRTESLGGDAYLLISKFTHVFHPLLWRCCHWTQLERRRLEESFGLTGRPLAWDSLGRGPWHCRHGWRLSAFEEGCPVVDHTKRL